MINLNVVNDFTNSIELESDFQVVKVDAEGDFILSFDSECDFDKLRIKVFDNPITRKKIIDNGVGFVELVDEVYQDGNRVTYNIYCSCGEKGYGSIIKMVVKKIQFFDNGRELIFFGFGMMRDYLKIKKEVV